MAMGQGSLGEHDTIGTDHRSERDRGPYFGPSSRGTGLDRARPRASPRHRPRRRHPGRRGSDGQGRARHGARRPASDPCLPDDLDAPGHGSREHRGQRRHGPQSSRRRRAVRLRRACRARHGAEALSRPLRGLWQRRAAGDAVSRGAAAARRRELLLCPGGRGVRRRAARRLRLERASVPHDHRRRRRQRDEHGRDARGLCHDLPRDRAPVHLSGLRGAMERPDRYDRCAPAGPPSRMGLDLRGRARPGVQRRQRRRVSVELDVGAACPMVRPRAGALARRGDPARAAAGGTPDRSGRTSPAHTG